MINMSVYYYTFFSIVVLGIIAQRLDKPVVSGDTFHHSLGTLFFYVLLSGVMIFVAGFRYRVGSDFGAYYKGYSFYIENLPMAIRTLNEPGYGVLAYIGTFFYRDGSAAIFMASLVTIALPMIIIYRHTDHLFLAVLIYYLTCWSGSFNGIRQYLAASVLFCGYIYLLDRKMIRYCIVVFLAFLFHRSAIVMVFIYPVLHRKINIQNILLIIVVTGFMLFSYDFIFSLANLIMEKEYSLNNAYVTHIVNRLRILTACLPAFFFLLMYNKKQLTETGVFYMNLTIIHAAVRILTMNSALLYRIGIYTSAFQTIAVTELLSGITGEKRKYITAGIVFMYMGLFWYELSKSSSVNNFTWIWEK